MDTVSFHVPILGTYYTMFADFLRFHFGDDYIHFYCHANEPAMATLKNNRKHHNRILQFLKNTPLLPVMVEKTDRTRHQISFEKTYSNIETMLAILRRLFPDRVVSLEILLYNEHYFFGRCAYHPTDLYEMGYLSMVPVVLLHKFYQQHKTELYTGLSIIARNAFQKYVYDFVELNFFYSIKDEFLRLSFGMLLQDRPYLKNKLDSHVQEVIANLPLKEEEGYTKLFCEWRQFHDMEVRVSDLAVPLTEWKPGLFLRSVSKLLDMFPYYFINPRFHLAISEAQK